MLQAAGAGAPTICILSNDTDVFVLGYWVWKANVHSAVQMEKWDDSGTILDKNARVSRGSMPYQDMILYPLHLCKGQGICTESTPGKCHAWSEYSAWVT